MPSSGASLTELTPPSPVSTPSTQAGLINTSKRRLSSTSNTITKIVCLGTTPSTAGWSANSSSLNLQLEQSVASSFEFPDDDSEIMAAADDQAASTSGLAGLAGLDPATCVMVQAVIKDQLAQIAALIEQKVQEGVNAKVFELQEAAEPKTPSCPKIPAEVIISTFFQSLQPTNFTYCSSQKCL